MSIICPITLQDLDPRDIHVMWDLIRFGALTDYQIDRRYGDPRVTQARLPVLIDDGLVTRMDERFAGVESFQATTRGFYLGRFGLKRHNIKYGQLGHDLAVVDLADALLVTHPAAVWYAEQQVPRALEVAANGKRIDRREFNRTPDGLLIEGGRLIAIELEHSIKKSTDYASICRWYAAEIRIKEIWWFTDDPAIDARIREVNKEHGYEHDITVRYEPFPAGVVVRQRPKP